MTRTSRAGAETLLIAPTQRLARQLLFLKRLRGATDARHVDAAALARAEKRWLATLDACDAVAGACPRGNIAFEAYLTGRGSAQARTRRAACDVPHDTQFLLLELYAGGPHVLLLPLLVSVVILTEIGWFVDDAQEKSIIEHLREPQPSDEGESIIEGVLPGGSPAAGSSDEQVYAAPRLFEEMAATGDATAQAELGSRFSRDVGIGQERDDAAATSWYKASAESGHVNAQHNYGVMLEREGKASAALVWYQKAADQGLPSAIFALGQLWYTGFHNDGGRFVRDVEKALGYFQKSANAGYMPAVKFVECAKSKTRVTPGGGWWRRGNARCALADQRAQQHGQQRHHQPLRL